MRAIPTQRRLAATAFAAVLGFALTTDRAGAQNAPFQAFLFDACAGAAGNMAVLCAQPALNGDVSGDSESSLNPSQTVSASQAALAAARQRTRELLEGLEESRDALNGRAVAAQPSDDVAEEFGRWSLLFNAKAAWFDRSVSDETSRERSFDGYSYSVSAGADYRLDDRTILGFLLGFDRTRSDFDGADPGVNFTPPNSEGDSDVDSYSLTVFGSRNLDDNVYVDGSFGFAYNRYDFVRDAVFQETARVIPQTNVLATGDTHGYTTTASLGTGYDAAIDAFTVGVYGRASVLYQTIRSYTEDDANASGLNMNVDIDNRKSVTALVGFRGSRAISTDFGVLAPQFRVELERELLARNPKATTSFVNDAGATQFAIDGDRPDLTRVNVGLGMVLVAPHGWSGFVDFQALVGYRDFERYEGTLGFRKEF